MDVPYRIRQAVPADATVVCDIERRCFPDPWSEASFREVLRSVWTVGIVAESAVGIIGYLIARELAGTGEILNLAVAPEARRRGVAGALLDEGLRRLRTRAAEEVFLEVRASNHQAQELYLTAGFREIGQRAGYYRNPREDALVLRLDLTAGRR